MVSTAEPELTEKPDSINPNWFEAGCILGVIGGAAIALGLLVALSFADQDLWLNLVPSAIIGMPAGGFVGLIESVLALCVLKLLPRRLLHKRWLAGLIAGTVAALVPVYVTFHDGYPTTDEGIWIGLGLTVATFAAGAGLTPIALRPRSRR